MIALTHGMSKPSLTPDCSAVPKEMKERHQWVLFRFEGEKNRKVPYRPNGKRASVKAPKTWSSFEQVVAAYNKGGFDGIGFVFTEGDPYCGIDLDGCRDPATGMIVSWAQEIINKLPSYTEVSVSGTGVHIIVRATIAAAVRVKGVEIYHKERFFTMSGAPIEGAPSTIEDAQEAVVKLWEELTAQQGGSGGEAVQIPEAAVNWDADPDSIWEQLEKIIDSDLPFRRTWGHDRPDLSDQSLSVYDLALLSQAVLVHGWTDPTELYLLLRLHREEHGDPDKKSKRRDYGLPHSGKGLGRAGEQGG